MKRLSIIGMAFLLFLSGCAPGSDKQDEGVQEVKDTEKKAVIPKYKISDKFYRTITPFEPSEARGLVVSNLNTRYDVNEMELGLMRIAMEDFNPDDYFYTEGQYLKAGTVRKWLNRKYTDKQAKEEKVKASDNIGLNPIDPGTGDIEKRNEENPLYLAHILEQNYLVQKEKDVYGLGGVVIGLAMNSKHYYQKEQYGSVYEVDIPYKDMVSQGKKMAEEVLQRLRNEKDIGNVPITIALYEQAEKTSVLPGNFISYTHVGEGKNKISGWKEVQEEFLLFPNNATEKKQVDDHKTFINFKQDIETYFPNFNGVVGRGHYVDDQLQEMKIEIPIQFYGKAEAVGFTQFATGAVMERFPQHVEVEVTITSVDGVEAVIIKKANAEEPYVHISQ